MSELAVGSIAGLAANSFVVDVASGSTLDLSAGAVFPAGSIIDVKHVVKTDTFNASVAGGASVAVTNLSITHETANVNNKLIFTAFFGSAGSSVNLGNVGIAINDGTNFLSVGDAALSRTRITAGGFVTGSGSIATVSMPHITIEHTPGAGSKTYSIHIINLSTTTSTLYVNRSAGDTNDASYFRSASALTLMEVAG